MAPDNVRSQRDVPPGYTEFQSYIRSCKTGAVEQDPDDHDLPPAIRVWGSAPFEWEITALFPQIDRDMALWGAQVLGGLVGVDGVTMVSDAITTVATISKEEGEAYERGSLTALWNEGKRDNLTECLMFHTAWLDGRHRAETSRYSVTDGVLRWANSDRDVLDTVTADGCSITGTVPEVLLEAITQRPPFLVMLTETFEAMGLAPEQAWLHRVRAALTILGKEQVLCMVGGSHPILRELEELPGAKSVDLSGGDPLEQMLKD